MSRRRAVIITCAVTGSVHTPSLSPHLPYRPEDIAAQAVAAARAGASILHLHARDPADGRPSPAPELFRHIVEDIRRETDAVINITTGGGQGMDLNARSAAARLLRPELASLNLGSMNFGIYPLAAREREWKFDWEKPFLEATRDFVFRNTFADIQWLLTTLGANGTRFEFECYDVGHLYNLAHAVEQGWARPPLFIQFVLGILGGIGADVENLAFMKHTADRLFGDSYRFSVLGAGRHQMPLAAAALGMGGHVRVGLEDSLALGPGELAPDNAAQVRHAADLVQALGGRAATPEEARGLLELRGTAVPAD